MSPFFPGVVIPLFLPRLHFFACGMWVGSLSLVLWGVVTNHLLSLSCFHQELASLVCTYIYQDRDKFPTPSANYKPLHYLLYTILAPDSSFLLVWMSRLIEMCALLCQLRRRYWLKKFTQRSHHLYLSCIKHYNFHICHHLNHSTPEFLLTCNSISPLCPALY
jgi:hypothetical protein